jgi:hypothetical protein
MWTNRVSPNPRHAFLAREMARLSYKCGAGCVEDPGIAADMLLFYASSGSCSDVDGLPLDRLFKAPAQTNVPEPNTVAFFRSSWCASNDSSAFATDALVLGMKHGDSSWSHGHADVGSFTLDVSGVRWAEDLGLPNYVSIHHTHESTLSWLFSRMCVPSPSPHARLLPVACLLVQRAMISLLSVS